MSGFEELDAALAAHAARKMDKEAEEAQKQEEQEEFDRIFSEFVQLEARQVFEMIGNHLHAAGHDFSMDFDQDPYRKIFNVYLNSSRADHFYGLTSDSHPSVAIIGMPKTGEVRFSAKRKFSSGGSQSGQEGPNYKLEEVNGQLVRDITLKVIIDCLKK